MPKFVRVRYLMQHRSVLISSTVISFALLFDGDAVLFDDSGELVFKQEGLYAFHARETEMADLPIEKGPYADFLIKLSKLQAKLPNQSTDAPHNPIRIALVTARNAPADMRAIKTLRQWGVTVDMAFFGWS